MEKQRQEKNELEKKFEEIKKNFEKDLKRAFELENENKSLSKTLEKINENSKTTREKLLKERQEEIKNLKAEVFFEYLQNFCLKCFL